MLCVVQIEGRSFLQIVLLMRVCVCVCVCVGGYVGVRGWGGGVGGCVSPRVIRQNNDLLHLQSVGRRDWIFFLIFSGTDYPCQTGCTK